MNEEKFSGKGTLYKRFRPSYPMDAINKAVSLSDGDVLADIGSGTGIFTRLLAPYFKKAYAVEPNADMRKEAQEGFVGTNIKSISGTAENTKISEKCVSLITAAQAFHWFDQDGFKKECKRILKPGGKVLLIWNERNIKSRIMRELFDLNKAICPSFHGFSGGFDKEKHIRKFFGKNVEKCTYSNNIFYNEEYFVGRNLSSSYAPHEEDKNYDAYALGLSAIFNKYEKNGRVEFPYETVLYFGGLE